MINALGNNRSDSFKAICEGKSGIRRITLFDTELHSVKIAAEVKDFDPTDIMDAKEVKKADRFIQLGLKAAKEAMDDAGFDSLSEEESERFGVSSASGIGGLPTIQKNTEIFAEKGPRRISPFFIPSALSNMLGGFASIYHNLKGPNLSNVTACTAGVHAITESAKTIMLGGADRMMAITAEATICDIGIGGFASMKALSTRNDEPEKSSRPFDGDRDGFVMGEGSGVLILEEYESAKKRGAKIYGEIAGFGESGDANHITSPTTDGPLRAMKAALKMAGLEAIDYVNAHGTSTPVNDKNETAALKMAFGGNVPPVSSTKGQTGHCLGAAGGIEAIISLMALSSGILPPTINQENPDPDCDLDYIPNVAREKEIDSVMSNSFGFGGTNGVIVFKKV
eukprot:TRINITY_DN8648_c0_g3_i1.p1 TRINITY_DN8648_c0_g3~~TRINITY_DN8648_c0_g3_i1.p1  ORF type:complete len:396 (-),score=34.41 TRINITY_DN8648_c0_g3_i1:1150-2337(-)